jgi:hypothetical protein
MKDQSRSNHCHRKGLSNAREEEKKREQQPLIPQETATASRNRRHVRHPPLPKEKKTQSFISVMFVPA